MTEKKRTRPDLIRESFQVRIVLKGNPDKLPDFGLGKGVIRTAVVTARARLPELAAGQLTDAIQGLIDDAVGYEIEPYIPKRRAGKAKQLPVAEAGQPVSE